MNKGINLQKLRTEILCAGVIGAVSAALFGAVTLAFARALGADVASEDVYAAFFLGGMLFSFFGNE